jgi:hypothetical protein
MSEANCQSFYHASIAIIPLCLTAIATYIVVQQFLQSRERFKLDLFDRRFAIFKAAQTFVQQVILLNRNNAKDSSPWIQQFQRDADTAIFLFDDSLFSYLNAIWRDGNRVAVLLNLVNDEHSVGPEAGEYLKEAVQIRTHMLDVQKHLTDKFLPYLKFSKWK